MTNLAREAQTGMDDHKLERLTEAWKYAKEMEQHWNQERVQIESDIYELETKHLPEKGTYTTAEGMKIVTGYTEEWDQSTLAKAYHAWPLDRAKFPFISVFKPDSKTIGVLRESVPDLYAIIRPALTLKPKKPAFSLKE